MNKKTTDSIELQPDAWQRFERFIGKIAKAGPQHREPKLSKKPRGKRGAAARERTP